MVLGLIAPPGRGESSFVVREWHREEGLPSEIVTDVIQDRLGYLWLSTTAGLVRFDGREFRLHVPPDTLHPSRSAMLAVFDHADGLWLVPRSGEPMIFRRGEFIADPLPPPHAGKTITAALLAPDGSQWLALRGGVVIRRAAGRIETFDQSHGVGATERTRFACDGRQRVWISSNRFLGRYENGTIVPVDAGTHGSELRIASSRVAGPWVLTDGEVLKLNAENQPELIARLPTLLGAHYVVSACEDRTGALWIGTRSQGVHRIKTMNVEHVPTSHESVAAVYEDTDGSIWVGTNSGGLNAIGPKIHQLYDKTRGLIENTAYSVCETPDGSIWCANGDGGVVKIWKDEITIASRRVTWPRFGVVSVAPSPKGHLWLAGPPGLYELDSDLSAAPTSTLSVPTGVRRLFVDRAGDTWFAVDPGRIGRWSRDGSYTLLESAVPSGDVRCFAEDKNGTLWIGTSQGALLRRDGENFIRVEFSTPARTGAINSIHFEDDNSLWLATAQAGLAVVRDGIAKILDETAGLPENNIVQLIQDKLGFVWCTSSTGIFRLSPPDVKRFVEGAVPNVTPVRLGRDDGLKAISCTAIYSPNAARGRDGRLWFATRQGVLAVDPSAALLNSHPRRVIIEEIAADNRTSAAAPRVTVPPRVQRLQIRFSILCLAAPRRVSAQYRLEGFDPDWLTADSSNVASYPRLRPGTYTFRVRAGTGPADGERVHDTMTIVVPPLWWQTAWFTVVSALLVLGMVAIGVRTWSTRRLRRQLQDLERKHAVESERARIAQNIHDDVGASLTHISLLTQAAADGNVPDNLNQIYETTREITRSLDEIVWAVNPRNDTLESFAGYLASYAQRFLHLAKIRCRLDIPDQLQSPPLSSQVRHHLFLCCREALNNIVKHSRATEVKVQVAATDRELTVTIEDDGTGIPTDRSQDKIGNHAGNGLRNMRERMETVGGRCSVEPAQLHRGTTVHFRVNLDQP